MCSITGFGGPVDAVHLVHREECLWWKWNNMNRYGADPLSGIDDFANLLGLRADLHTIFDARMFTIVPRNARLATYILADGAADYWPAYHNVPVQHVHIRSAAHLFARFAWAVLLKIKPFIC